MTLLDETTVARLKAPIVEREIAAQEAQERRAQKWADAKQLKDTLRLEELRQIPRIRRTDDEQREFSRLDQRQRMANEKLGVEKTKRAINLAKIKTVEEFWRLNRATVDGKKIHTWLEQQERVEDQLFWMRTGGSCSPQDPDFVSLEEGVADLDAFIAKHGLIHDDVYQSYVLQDFRPCWGVWAPKVIIDPIWNTVQPYWRDTERFQALCAESQATMIFAKFGIRTALPAYHVRLWKGRIAMHKYFHVHNIRAHNDTQCWLCNFERLTATVEEVTNEAKTDSSAPTSL